MLKWGHENNSEYTLDNMNDCVILIGNLNNGGWKTFNLVYLYLVNSFIFKDMNLVISLVGLSWFDKQY